MVLINSGNIPQTAAATSYGREVGTETGRLKLVKSLIHRNEHVVLMKNMTMTMTVNITVSTPPVKKVVP